MTRPKVPIDKRQRIAQACDTCKKRKQRCDGQKPCSQCVKRSLGCEFTPNSAREDETTSQSSSATKKRNVDEIFEQSSPSITLPTGESYFSRTVSPLQDGFPSRYELEGHEDRDKTPESSKSYISTPAIHGDVNVYRQVSMLQGQTGRIVYLGESSTWSYLQLVRLIVEGEAGESHFTQDNERHMMTESIPRVPQDLSAIHGLPNRELSWALLQSFYNNTCGLIDVLDRGDFETKLTSYYAASNAMSVSDTCLVYLAMAIGLVTTVPTVDSKTRDLIDLFTADPLESSEMLFASAKYYFTNILAGHEDGELWPIQAPTLMAVYNLSWSRLDAAYSDVGLAVRSAYSLGIHRPTSRENIIVFGPRGQELRRNIWQSLTILDHTISISLGRPSSISNTDDAHAPLEADPENEDSKIHEQYGEGSNVRAEARKAVGNTCDFMGRSFRTIYSKEKISTKTGQDLLDESSQRIWNLPPCLDVRNLLHGGSTRAEATALYYVDLMESHAIALLTRPFFLSLMMLMSRNQGRDSGKESTTPETTFSIERLSRTCVATSMRIISVMRTAYKSSRLPRHGPFLLQFLFTATLTIMSNEFLPLHHNDRYGSAMTDAMEILESSASSDSYSQRLLSILLSFREIIERSQKAKGPKKMCVQQAPKAPMRGSSSERDNEKVPLAGLKRSGPRVTLRDAPEDSKASMVHVPSQPNLLRRKSTESKKDE